MKKTSIKKTNQVLSVLLSSCMLLSATTAASATLVTDTTQNEQIQTNLPPEHTPKTLFSYSLSTTSTYTSPTCIHFSDVQHKQERAAFLPPFLF